MGVEGPLELREIERSKYTVLQRSSAAFETATHKKSLVIRGLGKLEFCHRCYKLLILAWE